MKTPLLLLLLSTAALAVDAVPEPPAIRRFALVVGASDGGAGRALLRYAGSDAQAVARVLTELVARGYVQQLPGRTDRRQRLLSLTEEGAALERRLFDRQRERLALAYRDAGGASVEGFRRVMRGIMDPAARAYMDQAEGNARPAGYGGPR